MKRRRRTRTLTRRTTRKARGTLIQATGSLICWLLVIAAVLVAVASCVHV